MVAFSIKIVQLPPHWKHFYGGRVGTFSSLKTAILEKYFHYFGKYSQRGLGPTCRSATSTRKWVRSSCSAQSGPLCTKLQTCCWWLEIKTWWQNSVALKIYPNWTASDCMKDFSQWERVACSQVPQCHFQKQVGWGTRLVACLRLSRVWWKTQNPGERVEFKCQVKRDRTLFIKSSLPDQSRAHKVQKTISL